MTVIVFGASGFIGQPIFEHFSKKDPLTAGTRRSSRNQKYRAFDITKPNFDNIDLARANHAILCIGFTAMDQCKTRESHARSINIEGMKKLIDTLNERGVIPIFLSTNYVFNGIRGNYTEDDPPSPIMAYGQQKREIEDYLISFRSDALILRLSHVYSTEEHDKTYLTSIANQLSKGESIRAATDQVFSPTLINDIPRAIETLIERKRTGIYHISSGEAFSRYELAAQIKCSLGIETGNIEPCSILDFCFADKRPLNTSLSTDKIKQDAMIELTSLRQSLNALKQTFRHA